MSNRIVCVTTSYGETYCVWVPEEWVVLSAKHSLLTRMQRARFWFWLDKQCNEQNEVCTA